MIKVLHLSHAMVWGGNEQQLVDLIPAIEYHNVFNTIFCFENSEIHKYSLENKLNFIATKKKSTYSFSLSKILNQIIIRDGYQIVHMHTSNSVGTFLTLNLLFSPKIYGIFSKKGISDSSSFFSKIKYNFYKIKKYICVSNAVYDSFSKSIKTKNRHKLSLIYDGINLDRISLKSPYSIREKLNIDKDTYLIGSIANHSPAKDLITLIRGLSELKSLGINNFFCAQIGKKSNLTKILEKEISDLGIDNHIKLLGYQDQASSFISQFDCFCLSSMREGLPLSILESFYVGTPVIATKAGGIPEAITSGFNGSLVAIEDYKNFGLKIKELLINKALKRKYIENSKEKLKKNFTNKVCAKNTYSVYNEVLTENNG